MGSQPPIRTVVWGTGNVGRAAIRAVVANPDLDLTAVLGGPSLARRALRRRRPPAASLLAGRWRSVAAATAVEVRARAGRCGRLRGVGAAARPDGALADLGRCVACRCESWSLRRSLWALRPGQRPAQGLQPGPSSRRSPGAGGSLFVIPASIPVGSSGVLPRSSAGWPRRSTRSVARRSSTAQSLRSGPSSGALPRQDGPSHGRGAAGGRRDGALRWSGAAGSG